MASFGCEKKFIESVSNALQRNVVISVYCDSHFTFLNLVDIYYRHLHQNAAFMVVFIAVMFPLCFLALSLIAEQFLSPAMQNLSGKLRLGPALSATTLVAFANGSPQVITCLSFKFKQDAMMLALSSLLGGFAFTSTFVVFSVSFAVDHDITLPKNSVRKELFFYASVLTFVCLCGAVDLTRSSLLFLLFAFYLSYVVVTFKVEKKQFKKIREEAPHEVDYHTQASIESNANRRASYRNSRNPSSGKRQSLKRDLQQLGNQPIASDDPFDQEGRSDSEDDELDNQNSDYVSELKAMFESQSGMYVRMATHTLTIAALLTIPGTTNPLTRSLLKPIVSALNIMFVLFVFELTQSNNRNVIFALGLIAGVVSFGLHLMKLRKNWQFVVDQVMTLLASIGWIKVFTSFLVDLVRFLAYYVSMPEIVLTVLVIGIGNSIGSWFSNKALAVRGDDVMAIMACYSGEMFNLFAGVAVVTYFTTNIEHIQFDLNPFHGQSSQFAKSYLLSLVLFNLFIILLTFLHLRKTNFVLQKNFGLVLGLMYLVHVSMSIGFLYLSQENSEGGI